MRKGETFSHHCLKCSYDWTGRKPSPTECPRCKNRRWQMGGAGKIPGAGEPAAVTPGKGAAKPGPPPPPVLDAVSTGKGKISTRPVLGCLCPPDDVRRGKHHKYCPYAEE